MKKSGNLLPNLLSILAVGCALTVTALVVRRELSPTPQSPESVDWSRPFESASNWPSLSNAGEFIGFAQAPIKIVVFSDFECPACRVFALGAGSAVRAAFPARVALVYRHYPLNYHRFAMEFAKGATCASRQGRFEKFHDEVFLAQESLADLGAEGFAARAGVADIGSFNACLSDDSVAEAIRRDITAAEEEGVRGTPTIFINGKRLPGVPDSTRLIRIVRELVG